ncbi:MAG TPA: LacI family DNA-binding transcriptional regulator [Terrimesophilobacter sp.]|nr:LacI family DNA-binding transcriptional regulator [Terrimesophilobacter sp.]
MARVVMKDVAQHASVSRATVSNFLNNPELLSSATRARIAASVETLSYVPSEAARKLRKSENTTIGFLAFEVSDPDFGAVADAVERQAQLAGWQVMIGNALGSVDREREYLELFERQRVGGIIVAPIGDVEDQLRGMRERGTRSVIVGRKAKVDEQPSVSYDDEAGGYQAVRHLLDLGRQRIAFIGGPFQVAQVNDRFQGAIQAVQETPGATLEFVPIGDRSVRGGRSAGAQMLARGTTLPEGVFAVNDLVAFGVMQSFQSNGISIPSDVAVIGFDDFDLDESAAVPLSSIRTPHDAIGEAAFNLVRGNPVTGHDHAENGSVQFIFQTELIARESTVG